MYLSMLQQYKSKNMAKQIAFTLSVTSPDLKKAVYDSLQSENRSVRTNVEGGVVVVVG